MSVLNVPIKISVVLGSCVMEINKLLKIKKNSIVELNKQLGSQVDVYADKKLIAQGELIIDGDHLGIVITKILT